MAKATAKTVQVQTPQSKDNPEDVKAEEIPLPPQEMWKELDNSGAKAEDAPASPAAQRQKLPVERLAFVRDAQVTIPLEFAFEWDGETVDAITMRRLTVAEVGDVIDTLPAQFDNYDIYAAMCGLPAAVLRGLIEVDGDRVAEVGYGFLPRTFRPEPPEAGSASGSS